MLAGPPEDMLWKHKGLHTGLSQGQGSNLEWACTAATAWAAGVPIMAPDARASPAAAVRTNIPARPRQPAAGTANAPPWWLPSALATMRAGPGPIIVSSFTG